MIQRERSFLDIDISWLCAAAICLVYTLALWRFFDVPYIEGIRYLSHVALFVALPGILNYLVLREQVRPSLLEIVSIGFALGFSIVALGFIGCSALGLRFLAPYASLVAGFISLVIGLARKSLPTLRLCRDPSTRQTAIAFTAIVLGAITLAAFEFFPSYPLPDRLPEAGATYDDDISWHIGNAAMLKQAWPPVDLRMVGVPFHYYLNYHVYAAATSMVTGIEVSTLVLRLTPTIFVILIALSLYFIGRVATKRPLGGVLVAVLGLFCSDLSILQASMTTRYLNLFIRDVFLSPTYALGLIIFIPLSVELGQFLANKSRDAARILVIAILLVSLASTKIPAMPIIIAASFGMVFLEVLATRKRPTKSLVAFVLSMMALSLAWHFVVLPGGSGYVKLAPFQTFLRIPAYRQILGGNAGGIFTTPLRAIVVFLGHAPLAWLGFAGYLTVRPDKKDPFLRFLLLSMLAGCAALLLIDGAGVGQLWFWFYGYVGLLVLSAIGFLEGAPTIRKKPLAMAIGMFFLLAAVGSTLLRSAPGLLIVMGWSKAAPGPLNEARVESLRWLRESTPKDSVIVIDHQKYLYASALSERQFLLENDRFMQTSYLYQFSKGKEGVPPNATFRSLTQRIFENGDADAIREVRDQYGVRYLVDDKSIGAEISHFDPAVASRVFSNEIMDVYVVR